MNTLLLGASLDAQITAAVITASVAATFVVIGQFLILWRERSGRHNNRQRQALVEVQDAALKLRGRLRDYGRALEDNVRPQQPQLTFAPNVPSEVESSRDDADGLLDVCLTRVESAAVRQAVEDWREAAMSRFISPEDVPAAQEAQAWRHLNDRLGRALRND